jgi:DedD protein
MEESALRDVERWKEKIEVRLDNRQVFFLFFGSAVVACMLFVLGVIVGKRIESRGRADAGDVQDPLAVLDRVHQEPAPGATIPPRAALTFPKALAQNAGSATLTPPSTPSVASSLPVPLHAKPLATATAPKPTPAAKLSPAVPKLAPAAPKPLAALPKAPLAPKAVALAAKPPVVAAPAEPAKVKGKYTLQLSAFPTREEADAFAERFAGQGTFVLPTDLPGKGTWFRVRCGNFSSYQEAIAAKAAFEKQNKLIALISAR